MEKLYIYCTNSLLSETKKADLLKSVSFFRGIYAACIIKQAVEKKAAHQRCV